jgi:hypothetical protein
MEKANCLGVLEEELQAQAELVHACAERMIAARDPRLRSAWVAATVCLMNASAATGSAMADIRWAPDGPASSAFQDRLRLPKLPPLPDVGSGPSLGFFKTTSSKISYIIRRLQKMTAKEGDTLLSSPACGGGAEQAKRRRGGRGSLGQIPPPA